MAEETTTDSAQLPRELSEAEEALIRQRRGMSSSGAPLVTLGLALSGGGIRSATLSLGLLQSLARQGLLPHVDYVSSVSGGGQ